MWKCKTLKITRFPYQKKKNHFVFSKIKTHAMHQFFFYFYPLNIVQWSVLQTYYLRTITIVRDYKNVKVIIIIVYFEITTVSKILQIDIEMYVFLIYTVFKTKKNRFFKIQSYTNAFNFFRYHFFRYIFLKCFYF